ncbi:2OG-Fe(II) oxygenase [Pseudoalteromonas sp. SMS1]|uniref:2OG-Fe(II) oxygenase n=1 Tax=Pseudoalteromonas sp. SMS1 TaxID=2908894 RepID=UPI001F472254|nr:2OG-Fe(II) oxygenase [Pseudoalteromonas sp. SMS1]MCF2859539.1 2OG-Fe(II) oxygenase [Pseudoalteromonas sp. SMS1]
MHLNTLSHNIFTINAFLTEQTCHKFILQAEQSGFQLADVDLGDQRTVINSIRNNERVDWFSESLAKDWWRKLAPMGLPELEQKRAISLSPRFRFYRYSEGQKFNMHKDGRQRVDGQSTMMTLLVYLNDNYDGGSTNFRQDNLAVYPKTGTALLFEHQLWHQGTRVKAGFKYILRTDVIYQNKVNAES